MNVHEAMTPNPHVIDPNTTIRDAARAMRENDVGALPVGENDRLVGMVTDRDIAMRAVAAEGSPGNTTVREAMSEGVCFCLDDEDLKRAARTMAEHQVQRLPVLNHDRRLVGMLSVGDLARHDAEALVDAFSGIAEPTGTPRR